MVTKSDYVGKFAHILSEEYSKYGIEKGELVFVAGSGFAPIDDDDNYKLLFVVSKVTDGVPSSKKGVTIVRKNLGLLEQEENDRLLKIMESKIEEGQQKGTVQAIQGEGPGAEGPGTDEKEGQGTD